MAWNWGIAPWMHESEWLRFGLTKQQIGKGVTLLNVVYIFNNFLVPVFATSITSSDCFYHFFVSSSNLVPSVLRSTPVFVFTNDTSFVTPSFTEQFSYTPPFVYNYQCASSLLVNYTPVFVILYVFLSISLVLFDIFARYTKANL